MHFEDHIRECGFRELTEQNVLNFQVSYLQRKVFGGDECKHVIDGLREGLGCWEQPGQTLSVLGALKCLSDSQLIAQLEGVPIRARVCIAVPNRFKASPWSS